MPSNTFPIHFRGEWDENGALRGLEGDLAQVGQRAKRQFENDFGQINQIIRTAISLPRGSNGALDIDSSSLRRAADDARAFALAAKDTSNAAERLQRETKDTTEATRLFVQASRAAAIEAEQEAQKLNALATSAERLQAELAKTAASTDRVVQATGRGTSAYQINTQSLRGNRQAMVQTGQQLQDITVSLASGQRASVVFAQQLPQLAFALSDVGGKVGSVARFLSGPWGAAVFAAITVVGLFSQKLFDNSAAADSAAESSRTFADRQNDLANFFDRTTGAIIEQNRALIENARLQRLDAVQAQRDLLASRRSQIANEVDRTTRSTSRFGGTFGNETGRVSITPGNPDLVNAILRARGNQGQIDAELARLSRSDSSNAGAARRISDLRAQSVLAQREIDRLNLEAESLRTGNLAGELRTGGGRRPRRGSDGTARENARLERQEDSASRLARIREQFDTAPRDIDRVNQSLRELDDILNNLERGRADAGVLASAREEAERIRALAQESLRRPITDRLREAEREQEIQGLRLSGLDEEADALSLQYDIMQRMGAENAEQLAIELDRRGVTADQYRQLFANLDVMRRMTEEAERQDELGISVAARLRQVQDIRATLTDSLYQAFNGGGNIIGGLVDGLRKQVNELLSRNIIESIFGGFFNDIEEMLRNDPRVEADRRAALVTDDVTTRMEELRAAAGEASAALSSIASAANDNGGPGGTTKSLTRKGGSKQSRIDPASGDIVVEGRRADVLGNVNAGALSNDPLYVMQVTFGRLFERFLGVNAPLAETLGRSVTSGLRGAAFGSAANSLFLGGRGSGTGSALGGALGGLLGDNVGNLFGKSAAQALGSFAGPLGSIAGGLIGGVVGKLFGGTKTGVANIGGSGSSLAISSFSGNSKSFQATAGKGGDSVISTIERIAEALGASVNASAGAVSIGLRDGQYRVDPTGRGATKTKKGAVDFGEDAEAAIRYATLNLIQDGVISGLRASQQRLLQAAKDIDTGLQKALDFGSVFTRLKQYKDPVGAALDALDAEFSRLRKIFDEAAATTEEYAALEELYGIERAKAIKDASERITASLRSLLDDLTVGNDAYSVSTRLNFARAKYDPLAQRVAAGDVTAYDDFAAAARELLDLQRQYSGSTIDYFNLLEQVTGLTRSRISSEDNVSSIASLKDGPFSQNATAAIADSAQTVSGAISDQTGQLLDGFASIMGDFARSILINANQGGPTPAFISAAV